MATKLDEKEVDALLKRVADAAEKLVKASPGQETSAEETPEGSSTSPPSDGPPGGDASPSPDASASPPPGGDAGAPPAGDPAMDGGDPGAAPAPTLEQLQAAYAALPPEELKMHLLAIKGALMAQGPANDNGLPGAAGPSGPPPGPEASASASPSPSPSPPPGPGGPPPGDPSAPAMKGEMGTEIKGPAANGGKVSAGVSKAESDPRDAVIAELKKKQADTDAALAAMTATLVKVVSKPLRKAVTSVAFVAKPGSEPQAPKVTLTREQALPQLTKKIRSEGETLTKSDRDLIRAYVGGQAPIESVAKFLTLG